MLAWNRACTTQPPLPYLPGDGRSSAPADFDRPSGVRKVSSQKVVTASTMSAALGGRANNCQDFA